jgi:hypothetical protein
VYFIWKQSILFRKIILPYLLIVLSAAYMNVLPSVTGSDSLLLTFIHFPLCLWSLTGYIYSGADIHNLKGRLLFLRYNGDVIVMATIILLAGGLMTGLTIQLFSFIQLDIKKFYVDYIVVWGLAGAPVIATFLVSNNPQLVARVSPTIAKIFTPLVLVTLVVYLFAMIFNGKDPYQDREFLLVFNAVLVGVLALILFSIAEKSGQQHPTFSLWLLWVLSLVTIVVNGIALSAILFRIHSWGLTANRLAVLGGNVLILLNLLLVSYHLLRSLRRAAPIDTVENSIARYLPVYSIWTMVVAFVFPWVFHFK